MEEFIVPIFSLEHLCLFSYVPIQKEFMLPHELVLLTTNQLNKNKTLFCFPGMHILYCYLRTHQMAVFLWHGAGLCLESIYSMSSSVHPPSNIENSYGTPSGWHRICEKIGDHVPVEGIFTARKFTGCVSLLAKTKNEKAYVTTRILRLDGCTWGENKGFDLKTSCCCDTFKRCIYIHGTNLEAFIPQPLSKGCLLLKTNDLLTLFSKVHCGDLCFIDAYGV